MYYLLLILLYPLALMPLRVLYVLSDACYLLLYHVLGYRKAVVRSNLKHAFPEKTPAELLRIERRFYHSFCDQWIETLKLLTISRAELERRMTGNWEVLQNLGARGINVYMLTGHIFNWEWLCVAGQYHCANQQYAGVYLPVENKAFDRLMKRLRSSSGTMLISMKAKKTAFQALQQRRFILGLMADQNPSHLPAAVWLPFLHREAPFFRGPELMARKGKAAVVFAGIRKVKRGHYAVHLHSYCDDASTTAPGDVMRDYVRFMEDQVRTQPENWMWTHKRWKHTKP